MCDYSLENKISRAAKVGDKLVTCSFPMTPTRGFCAEKEPNVAICLLPGTELAFEGPIKHNGLWGLIMDHMRARLGNKPGDRSVARFRQVELNNPHTHHDALELADGRIVKLTMLQEGQRARVLQLPANVESAGHPAMAERLREAAERHDEQLAVVR